MKFNPFIALCLIAISSPYAFGQKKPETGTLTSEKKGLSCTYKHSIGASLLMISNFFPDPAYALKYWPVDTNFPEEFAEIEAGAPNYIFEPSLNFGFKF